MTRRWLGLAAATALTVGVTATWALPRAGHAAQEGGVCTLSGVATLSPGLTTTTQAFQYSFKGTLSNCKSSDAAVTGGTVFEGNPEGSLTGTGPFAQGSGSCAASTTSGKAVIVWNNGKTTVVSYKTTGAVAEVALQGAVITSATVNGLTYTTTEFAVGDTTVAQLVFGTNPPPPAGTENCATVPVTSASINGVTAVGSAS